MKFTQLKVNPWDVSASATVSICIRSLLSQKRSEESIHHQISTAVPLRLVLGPVHIIESYVMLVCNSGHKCP